MKCSVIRGIIVVIGFFFVVNAAIGQVRTPQPDLTYAYITTDDTSGGDGDGLLEPGESAEVFVTIFNKGTATAWDVFGTLSTDEPEVIITQRLSSFGTVYPKSFGDNLTAGFEISLSNTVPCGKDLRFVLDLEATNFRGQINIVHPMREQPLLDMATFPEDVIIYGDDDQDRFGGRLSSGDFNGDGIADLFIGAYGGDGIDDLGSTNGEITILYGNNSWLSSILMSSPPAQSSIIYEDANLQAPKGITSGDVNGDGFDDLIYTSTVFDGPPSYPSNNSGLVRVVFGSDSLPAESEFSSLSNGTKFSIYGKDAFDGLGESVACGDINNDGFDDIVVGAQGGAGIDNLKSGSGEVYIIFGRPTWPSSEYDLGEPNIYLDLTVIYGIDEVDLLGNSVAVGDVNGDGFDDVSMLACGAFGSNNARPRSGETYILYGQNSMPTTIDLSLEPNNVSTIYHPDIFDLASLNGRLNIGNINGDNYKDIFISLLEADGPGNSGDNNGEIRIVLGSSELPEFMDLADAPEGTMTIYGAESGDTLSHAAAGDFNSDGYDDLVVSATLADGIGNARTSCGESWVLLGATDLPAVIDLNHPMQNMLHLIGRDTIDYFGIPHLDDFNGDGFDDIAIGAYYSNGAGNAGLDIGEVSIINGKPDYDYYLSAEASPSWIDASSGDILPLFCDSCCMEVPLGFTFEYYGQKYSSIWVCEDGFISFSPISNPMPITYCLPYERTPNNIIAAFWEDLDLTNFGYLFSLSEGTEPDRRITIQWDYIPLYGDIGGATFEITLFEGSNHILVQYDDTTFGTTSDDGANAMAGIENATGTNGQYFSCEDTLLTAGSGWRAIPFGLSLLDSHDFDDGALNGWTNDGPTSLWHMEAVNCAPHYRSPSYSWYYGDTGTCQYDEGTTVGTLISPSLDADFYSTLDFWSRCDTEGYLAADLTNILVAEDGGLLSQERNIFDYDGLWKKKRVYLSSHSGHSIEIGFEFDTVDAINNGYLGWMIDDYKVWGCDVYDAKAMKAYAFARPKPVCELDTMLLDGVGSYATGCSGVTYQWYEDDTPIPGATDLTHVVAAEHDTGSFTYYLEMFCPSESRTVQSEPISVQFIPFPVEVPDGSFMLEKINDGADILYSWTDVDGGDFYNIYTDTDPTGTFASKLGEGTTGSLGTTTGMPSGDLVFLLIAGANETCGEGPKR